MIDCVRTSSPSQTSSCVIASGGIWLFCREDLVDVEVLPHSSQALNVIIRRVSEIDCLFTAIYANPNPASREELWEYLHCKVCPLNSSINLDLDSHYVLQLYLLEVSG